VFEHLINNKEVGITPNDATFNGLIDAYVRQNNMNKVLNYYLQCNDIISNPIISLIL
jgi:pentatricopeptide repeat protein